MLLFAAVRAAHLSKRGSAILLLGGPRLVVSRMIPAFHCRQLGVVISGQSLVSALGLSLLKEQGCAFLLTMNR